MTGECMSSSSRATLLECWILVTSIQSLLQPVPGRDALAEATREIRVGEHARCAGAYEVARRAGRSRDDGGRAAGRILAARRHPRYLSARWYDPVRIEFFGDEVESIRRFEVATQRSLASLDAIDVTVLEPTASDREHFAAYLPPETWFLLVEPGELEGGGQALSRAAGPAAGFSLRAARRSRRSTSFRRSPRPACPAARWRRRATCGSNRSSGSAATSPRSATSSTRSASANEMFIVCQTEAEVAAAQRSLFADTQLLADGPAALRARASDSAASAWCRDRSALVSGSELFHRDATCAAPPRRRLGRAIDSFLDLREGDWSSTSRTASAAIAACKLLEKDGQAEEHLELEFDGGTKIYVPAIEDRPGAEVRRRHARRGRRCPRSAARRGCGRRRRPRQPSSTWPSRCSSCRPCASARPGIAFPPTATGSTSSTPRSPTTKRPTSSRRSPRSRATCSSRGRWTGCSAATSATARPKSRCGPRSRRSTTASRSPCWCRRRSWPSSTTARFRERMAEFPFDDRRAQPLLHAEGAEREIARRAGRRARSTSSSARTGWRQHDVQFHNLGLVIIDEEQRFGVEVKERLKALRHDGRRADADGHADSADAAHVAAGRARHLEPGDAAGRPPGGRDAGHAVRARR